MGNNAICPNCKKMLQQGAVFCPNCGARVDQPRRQGSLSDTNVRTISSFDSVYLPGGTVLQGKYRINSVIGQGGFGITYDGTDLKLQMHIAIKEFFPGQIADRAASRSKDVTCTSTKVSLYEQGMRNFLKEARNMAKFAGQANFVSVHDIFSENNTAYIVMEFVEGTTLRKYMQQHGKFSMDAAMAIMTPVLNALEKIHSEGMIHRDISPSNIMVLPDGRVKLLDFGAVRDITWETQTLTTMSAVYKKGYSPIEQQTTDMNQGTYSDIYAFCATIYEMLTGSVPPSPFSRLSGEETLKPPSAYGVQLSPSQEETLIRGLEVYPQDRIQTAAELREGLSRKEIPAAPDPDDTQAEKTNDWTRTLMIVLECAAVILFILLVFLLARRLKKEDSDSSSTAGESTVAAAEQDEKETIEEGPSVEETVSEESVQEEAAAQKPAEEETAAEEPAEEETAAEEPAEEASEEAEAVKEESVKVVKYPAAALSYGGHHYYIYNDTETSWEDCMDKCRSRGGYMAVINDADENETLYQYMVKMGFEEAYFGLYLQDKEWDYLTGDTSDFRDWGVNSKNIAEPNNADGGEIHAELDIHMHDGHWNDSLFGREAHTPDGQPYKDLNAYICEWNQ